MSPSIDNLQRERADERLTVLSVLEDDGFEQLARVLAEEGRERIVVVYDPGSIAVARALAANQPPSTSLGAWKRRASRLLDVYRPNRHRTVFASAAAVKAEPKQFRNSLSKYFKLSEAISAVTEPSVAPNWSAWQLALANQALAADAEAVLLDRELEAAALPLSPVSCDIDEAFTELQAAASSRALLLRQLANVRKEACEQFLRAAAAETSPATVGEKPKLPEQSAKKKSDEVIQNPADKAEDSVENKTIGALPIGQIVMDQYYSLMESNYSHIYISLYDVTDRDLTWHHIKFKLCSWNGREYIEFRRGPSLPEMFEIWPGEQEDQFGPYLNYPNPSSGEAVEISKSRDRRLLRLIFNILEQVIDAGLNSAKAEEVDKSAWLEKARRLARTQRKAMASWDVGDKVPPVAKAR